MEVIAEEKKLSLKRFLENYEWNRSVIGVIQLQSSCKNWNWKDPGTLAAVELRSNLVKS